MNINRTKNLELFLEKLIFASRWIQLPVYLGLILGTIFYIYKFFIELWHLISHVQELTETFFMLGILTLVDMIMVINLIIIIIIGGYSIFVSKMNLDKHEDEPDWLEKMNAGTMKVKLVVSLVSISGIHLLKVFMNIENTPNNKVWLQIAIHFVFLISAILLAYTDKILNSSHEK